MKSTLSLKTMLLASLAMGSSAFVSATPEEAPVEPTEIAEFLKMDIAADSRMEDSKVSVELKDGVAVLTGNVSSLALAERATARAIAAQGVRSVVNQLSIRQAPLDEISAKAKAALKAQSMVDAKQVKISVANDRLVIRGSVGTWDEKDLVREVLSEIPGLTAIDNKLEVTFEGIREDSQIQEQLRFIIHDDPLYDGLNLVATVEGGTATLSGTVGSKDEFYRLVRRSYVTGIMDVSISNLHIDSDLKMEALGDKQYTPEESVAALTQALKADPRIDANTVKVAVDEGVAVLKGSVATLAAKDAAEAASRAIPGVLRVENKLSVSPRALATTGTAYASAPVSTGR